MLNSRAVFDPLWRATDANGDPIPGAQLKFYLSETTTPMTVYADAALTVSLGTTVTCDSGGYPTSDGTTKQLVYVGVQDFKIVVTDADDVTVVTHDKQQGAVDPNDLPGGTGGSSTTSVEAGAGDYTVVTADAGKLLNRSSNFVIIPVSNQTISHAGKASAALAVTDGTASASDDITLPSAITEGDGFTIGFKHSATGEVVWLASDGANWIAYNGRFPWVRSNAPYLLITDRLNQAPTSPTPGALYIVQGTPTGSWATAGYDEHDVLEADGNGGWIEHNPQVGWQAYVTDENVLTVYKSTGWDDATNAFDAGSDYIEMAVFEHQQTNGTAGGGATSGSRQTYPLTTFSNSASANVITGASLTTNKFKLPVGWYRIDGEAAFRGTDGTQLYLRNDTSSTDLLLGLVYNVQGSAPAARTGVMLNGVFQVTDATHDHVVQYRVETTVATNGLGEATSFSEGVEVYGRFVVAKMQAPAGSQGDAGPQGAAGAGYAGTSTTSKALANSGSQTITTQTGLAYTAGCRVKLSYSADVAKFMEGGVTAYNSGTGSLTFTADYAEGSGTYADWLVSLTGARGANGATGAAGPTAVDYTGDNGTSAADPGSGKIRVNNASMASATAIYINETDRHGTSQAAWIATLDDSTSTVRGQLYVYDLTTTTQKWVFSVTGSITDNGSYDTITVAYVSGPAVAMPTNNVALQFHRTGDAGPQGAAGAGYAGTSTTSKALANSGSQTITTQTGLAYTAGCRVKLSYSADVAKFMEGGVTAYNSGTGSLTFTADYAEGSGTYADWLVNLTGARGANGATGAAGPTAVDYTGDNGTSAADPGSGKIRVNNASMASATAIYINETDRHGTSQAAWIATLDDSTSTVRGQLYVYDLTTTTQKWVFSVTGSITDNGSYDTITVAYVSGPAVAMPTNNVALQFHRTGDAGTGAIGGSSGATDNRLIRADGTGGATVQSSAVTVDDNGGITLPADVILSGVLSPSSFSTTQNDYAPTGHATASVFRLTATAASSVTGLTAPSPAASRVVRVVNIGTYTITLKDESASSTAANRFALDCDIQLAADTSCVLIYDTATARWRCLSRPAVGKIAIPIDSSMFALGTSSTRTTDSIGSPISQARSVVNLGGSAGATANTACFVEIRIPKGVSVSTLTVQAVWSQKTTNATAGVVLTVAALATSDGDSFDAAYGTAVNLADSGGTANTKYETAESAAITPAGSPVEQDSLWIKVGRDVAHASDTLAQFCRLHSLTVYLTTTANTAD